MFQSTRVRWVFAELDKTPETRVTRISFGKPIFVKVNWKLLYEGFIGKKYTQKVHMNYMELYAILH